MPHFEKQIVVANKKGLHARPAALFVQLAGKYDAAITVAKGSERVNGRSIMGLLMLCAQCESVLTITVDGQEAQAAMAQIEEFFSKQEEEYNK